MTAVCQDKPWEPFDKVLAKVKDGDCSEFTKYLLSNEGYVFQRDDMGKTLLLAALDQSHVNTEIICTVLDIAKQQASLLEKYNGRKRTWWSEIKINSFVKKCITDSQMDILKPCAVWAYNNNTNTIIDDIINHAVKHDSSQTLEMMFCTDYDLNSYQSSMQESLLEYVLKRKSKFKVVRFLLLNLRNRILYLIEVSRFISNFNQLLIESIQHNDLPVVTILLELNLDRNLKIRNSQSILMKACSLNHARIAQKLIDEGADVNYSDRKGWTALMEACYKGNYESVNVCLSSGADISARDHNDTTPLLAACKRKNNVDVVEILLQNKAKLNEQDANGRNALVLLVESRSYYCLREFITQWDYEIDNISFEHFKRLFSVDMDQFLKHKSVMKRMTYEQIIDSFKYSLESDDGLTNTIDFRNFFKYHKFQKEDAETLFQIAVKNSIPIYEIFLDNGNAIDYSCFSLFHAIEKRMPSEIIKSIIRQSKDLDDTNDDLDTALHMFVKQGKESNKFKECINELLKRGVNVNAKNKSGETPLHLCKFPGVADILCHHGASLDIEDENNKSPWMQAVESDSSDNLSVFIEYRIDKGETIGEDLLLQCLLKKRWQNLKLLTIKSPLIFNDSCIRRNVCEKLIQETKLTLIEWYVYSIVEKEIKVSQSVLDFFINEYELNYNDGDNINLTSAEGVTLLMHACSLGYSQSAEKLISLGVDVTKKDQDGQNVLFYCESKECVEILTEYISSKKLYLENCEMFYLMYRMCCCNQECLHALLKYGISPNIKNPKNGKGLLQTITERGPIGIYKKAIEALCDFGCDLDIKNERGDTVFLQACKNHKYLFCEWLLNINGLLVNQVDCSGKTVLHIAIERRNEDFIDLLLKYPVDLNISASIFKLALNFENMDIVMKLLEKGFDPQGVTNEFGESALVLSCQSHATEAKEVSKFLLSKERITSSTDEFGRTLLHLALANMQHLIPRVISFLEETCNVKDNFGRSFLHVWRPLDATYSDHISKCIKGHMDINQTDFNGQTALHLACYEREEEVRRKRVNFLHDNGVDINIKDKNGFKASDIHSFMTRTSPENIIMQFDIHVSFHKEGVKPFSVVCKSLYNELIESQKHKTFVSKLCSQFLFTWSPDKVSELRDKANTILSFFTDVGELMGKREPFLMFKPKLAGSCQEGTKIKGPNEMDILCILKNWKLDFFRIENDFSSLVELYTDTDKECVHPFICSCERQKLSRIVVFEYFYFHLGQILQSHELWKRYPKLCLIDTYDINHRARNITSLKLIWCGKLFPYQEFNIDVVPTFFGTDSLPSICRVHELLRQNGYYVVPKFTLDVIRSKDPDHVFQLSFNKSESDLFSIMPSEIKQGYMLAKVLKELCPCVDDIPADDLITSYMLKTCAFKEFESHHQYRSRMDMFLSGKLSCDNNPYPSSKMCPTNQIVYYAKQIFARLQVAIQNQFLGGYFLPKYNLLGHKTYQENFRPGLYAQFCKTLLTGPKQDPEAWKELINYQPMEYPTLHAASMGKLRSN